MATPPRSSSSDTFGVNACPEPFVYPQAQIITVIKGNKSNNNDENDHLTHHYGGGQSDHLSAPRSRLSFRTHKNVSLLSGLGFTKLCFRSAALATITLYVLNQKHMLPKPLSMLVSRALFWPTLPITASQRIGQWATVIDNAVVLGGAPFSFLNYPEKLHSQFRVRGVVNMCEEYQGPVQSYQRLGIEHLRLPTVDHFEPSVDDLKKAVSFIQKHEAKGGRVYVHCRAGHGRSAAAVYAWLLYKEPLADPVELNEKMCSLRNVRKSLHSQPNVNVFRRWLQNGGMVSDSDDDEEFAWPRKIQSASGHLRRNRDDLTRYRKGTDYDNGIGNVWYDEEKSSENNEDVYLASSLGRVFSDEDFTDDWTSKESSQCDDEYYDYSEDEFYY